MVHANIPKFKEKTGLQNNKKLASKIFKDRTSGKMTFMDIGDKYNIPSSEAFAHYKYGESIHGEYAWLDGLSPRAQNQIKRTEYKDFATLNHDVVNNLVQLEDFPWIGCKVAQEIRKWLIFPNDRRKRERRTKGRDE